MKNRYLLCLLICCALIYIAVPRIHPSASGLEGVFAISWLGFAFLVFAGNLAAFLFPYKYKKKYAEGVGAEGKSKKRLKAN